MLSLKTSNTESITSMLSSQQKEDIARNRHTVMEIIDVLILCGFQYIAIWGVYQRQKWFYDNFASCVQIRWSTIQYHLDNPVPKSRIKYTSPDIQNKIPVIEISDEMVGEKIVRACNDFEYFGLVGGDEAIDVSTHEQACV